MLYVNMDGSNMAVCSNSDVFESEKRIITPMLSICTCTYMY